jgi:malate dehydrogenase (quinone)
MASIESDLDVVVIGAGIMGATLAVMLKRLEPTLRIQVFEAANEVAQESSSGWHNAGTGHAGLCELSYTPSRGADGEVDVAKAIEIFEQFEVSRQFWASCVRDGLLGDPGGFLQPVPHVSFVHGAENVGFLRSRFDAMQAHHFFSGMQFSSERETLTDWLPLVMQDRKDEPVAATRSMAGTDVNFGSLSKGLTNWLNGQEGASVKTSSKVTDLTRSGDRWTLQVQEARGKPHTVTSRFVFIGAGGGSLPLLQRSGIPEGKGIGGFPIGGQWLVCDNPDVVQRHRAKVYGQALGAAPTMAVPHLDTRMLDGKRYLMFGPFAAWTMKFLHESGSQLDLLRSVKPHNVTGLVRTGVSNLDLIRYLYQQGTQSREQRMAQLRDFYPSAAMEDWKLIDAGIRVQAIKNNTEGKAGIVHYGTEVVTDKGGTLSVLLGASPGASVSAYLGYQVVERCFPHLLSDPASSRRMKEMVPTYDVDIKAPENAEWFRKVSQEASRLLKLPCEG